MQELVIENLQPLDGDFIVAEYGTSRFAQD